MAKKLQMETGVIAPPRSDRTTGPMLPDASLQRPKASRRSGCTGMRRPLPFFAAFRILYCLVIIRHGRRILVSFGVTENPTAEWISRQITEAFPWDHAPRYLIRDRDTSYGPVFLQRLRAMGIRDRPIAFRS